MSLPGGLSYRVANYGAPRFHAKGKEHGTHAIVGAELTCEDGSVLPLLVRNRMGYQIRGGSRLAW